MLACIFSESNSQAVNITKFALSNRAILLFGSVVVSIEINRTTIGTKKVHLGDIHLNSQGLPFPRQQLCLCVAITDIAVPNGYHTILRRMPNVYVHLSIYSAETISD